MQALFNIESTRVQWMSDQMAVRTGCMPNYVIEPELSEGGAKNRTVVRGGAQDVMFLIGEVASHGEAALISVTSSN